MFLLTVYISKKFYVPYRHINIHRDILTIHLEMTKVWSKRLVLLFIFIVKSFTKSLFHIQTQNKQL